MEISMGTGTSSKPSFSRGRKWSIGFNIVLAVILVVAVVVMVNYLSGRYFKRDYLSTRTRIELSPRTISLLRTITNDVQITYYCDPHDDQFYGDVTDLLKEYNGVNPRLKVKILDYLRDPGAAVEFKAKYSLGTQTNKNFFVFDRGGPFKVLPGGALVDYALNQLPYDGSGQLQYERKLVAFKGEMMFSSTLLTLMNPKPLKAYFLERHGEHQINDGDDLMGYLKLADWLKQNYIDVAPLSLVGTNAIPDDCNLLIIAGPKSAIAATELEQIENYLNEGGSLLAMFNLNSVGVETGLEKLLAKWGIGVGHGVVQDTEFYHRESDVLVQRFANHPLVSSLINEQIDLVMPREIRELSTSSSGNAPKVDELAFSGSLSFFRNVPDVKARVMKAYPLMAAAEKAVMKGATPQRGTTRILVVGDSIFLGNAMIEIDANREFAFYAVDWLLDRNLLLEGMGPRSVSAHKLEMTPSQTQSVQWLLLGAMPGGILLFGGMVWFRRRK
jgi:hypothetical protein